MDIYLIRHTRVQGVEGICYGRSEVPLASGFEEDAETVKQKLPSAERRFCFSSPSLRCRSLAEYLSEGQYNVIPELGELDFGLWEMQAWDAVPRDALDEWARNYLHVPCPQGESLEGMQERVLRFWYGLPRRGLSPIILVTHAGPIRIILSHLLERPVQEMFSLPVDFAGISKIIWDLGEARIDFMNG